MQAKTGLSRKDVITGYIARGLSICSGIIVLPIILRELSEGEIAVNYIMTTLMSLVALFDMGFSSQFSRNFSFVFGGAQCISREGIPTDTADFINYEILYRLIKAAKKFYGYMTIALLGMLLSFGTWYIYRFTDGFSMIDNILYIWICFSCSVALDFYYKYYTPLLMGKGMIKEVNGIEIFSIVSKLILLLVLIFCGFGLWSIVLSNLLRIIIVRFASLRCFYTQEIKEKFVAFKKRVYNDWDVVKTLWFNAKKTLVVSITNYTCSQLGLFFSGIYLGKTEVASYGLLLQLVNIITSLSLSVNQNTIPLYSSLRARGERSRIIECLFFSVGALYWIFWIGGVGLLLFGPSVLRMIGANATLPALSISIIVVLYNFLQNQHVICSSYLCSQNKIVDFESSTILGIVNLVGIWAVLRFTDFGLMGIVVVQFLTALAYPNWKWPYEVCKEFKISFPKFVYSSVNYTFMKAFNVLKKI